MSVEVSPVKQEASTQTEEAYLPVAPTDVDTTHAVEILSSLPQAEQLRVIADLLYTFGVTRYRVNIPHDFLPLSLRASQYLQQCGRSNVVYELARAIGRMRPDGSNSRLPAKRMPMGLVEHLVHFFNADTYQKVRYRLSHW